MDYFSTQDILVYMLWFKHFVLLVLGCIVTLRLYGGRGEFLQVGNLAQTEKEQRASILFYAGLRYWNRTEPRHAPFVPKVMAIAQKLKTLGETDAALYWYRLAFTYGFLAGNTNRLEIYNQLGLLHFQRGNYAKSLYMYHQAYSHAPEMELKAKVLVNQSNVYQGLKDMEKALDVLEKSLPIFKSYHLPLWSAISLGNQAMIYYELRNFTKAVQLNIRAYNTIVSYQDSSTMLQEKDRIEVTEIKCRILSNLAEVYLQRDLPDSAYYYLAIARRNANILSDYTKSGLLMNYGIYFGKTGQKDSAALFLIEAFDRAVKGDFADIKIDISNALANVYSDQRNFQRAFYWKSRSGALKDSLTSFENIHRINALETQYYLSQKDKILAEKELKITQQTNKLQRRNWIVFTSIVLSLAVFIILVVSRKSYRNKQKLLSAELNQSRQQQKLARMEAMIDGETKERTRIAKELHDSVVNEVLALKLNLTDLEKDFSTLRYAPKFKGILHQSEEVAMRLRETAHNLLPAKIRENGLFNTIGAFIEKINAPVHFTFQHYGTLPALDTDTERIILLSVLELIQNILKHARASEALVQLNYFEDVLSITVEDNGVGLPPKKQKNEDKGIGLQGVLENMKILGATIDIQSSEYTGTTVLIEIPLSGFKLQQKDLRDTN